MGTAIFRGEICTKVCRRGNSRDGKTQKLVKLKASQNGTQSTSTQKMLSLTLIFAVTLFNLSSLKIYRVLLKVVQIF
jgi:hypothetical protein